MCNTPVNISSRTYVAYSNYASENEGLRRPVVSLFHPPLTCLFTSSPIQPSHAPTIRQRYESESAEAKFRCKSDQSFVPAKVQKKELDQKKT